MEIQYVKNTYEIIAEHFSSTRNNVWGKVAEYMNQLPENSYIADIGCGNGKNMFRKDCEYVGMDFCMNFTKICKERQKEVIKANNLNIPFKSNSFDHCISVAVIHHLSTVEKRLMAIDELVRIVKPNGTIFISVWALEQPDNSRRKFTKNENMVEWNYYGKKFLRYYHVFSKGELEKLASKYNITHSFYEQGNWIIVINKN
jgi:ubiquinone/menaquinone biosynthesis C-methylase UbiE